MVDDGSSRCGAAAERLLARYPNLILVHLPTHASRRNQIEPDSLIVQRPTLTPNDFPNRAAVAQHLHELAALDNDTTVPFHWRCTRQQREDRRADGAATAA